LSEEFDPELRRHVAEVYRESNTETARLLADHGYSDLPGWLRVSSAA
jgi:hypothetical protein